MTLFLNAVGKKSIFALCLCSMEKLQFCAIMLMSLLSLTLAILLPRRMVNNPVARHTNWLMVIGLVLLVIQFLLQYRLGLRSMGVIPAVILNLLFFIPCSYLFCIGELYLLRQGYVRKHEWWIGVGVWLFVAALFVSVSVNSHASLFSDNPGTRGVVVAGSILYALMQCYYSYLHFRELRLIRKALSNYYDSDRSDLLHWMRNSMLIMVLLPLFVPLFIFGPQCLLMVYGLLMFAGIYFLVISFVCYIVSNDANTVMEAERPVVEKAVSEKLVPTMDESDRQRIDLSVNRWLANKGHLKSGINIQNVADELKIPRYQLNNWLKANKQESFSSWLAALRIEEAKRLMIAHPEWSNDVIAEQSGFSSRSYFHTVFHKMTGLTPAKFLEESSSLK